LTRAHSSVLFQLRTGHVPLNKYLYRIGKVDSPRCPSCRHASEDVRHFLLECRAHRHERWILQHQWRRQSQDLRFLLSSPKALIAVLRYVQATGRFKT
ncbi:hypothetical protein FA95DRAFT_1466860, partial [Auriscalpium vulgare]